MSDYGIGPGWEEAKRLGYEPTEEEKYQIAMGWKTIEDVLTEHGWHGSEELVNYDKLAKDHAADLAQYSPGADESIRNITMRYMNGDMDTSFDTFATARTAGIPRQYSQQASSQAAQIANSGLSGSGLAARAQRNNKLDENDAMNAGMAAARGDYQQNVIGNRQKAMDMLAQTSDTKAQRAAAAALERANRLNEKATDKSGGAQQAYEFIGGIRNGLSGDNGVF